MIILFNQRWVQKFLPIPQCHYVTLPWISLQSVFKDFSVTVRTSCPNCVSKVFKIAPILLLIFASICNIRLSWKSNIFLDYKIKAFKVSSMGGLSLNFLEGHGSVDRIRINEVLMIPWTRMDKCHLSHGWLMSSLLIQLISDRFGWWIIDELLTRPPFIPQSKRPKNISN